ncbi:hypothetical protein ACFQL4_03675 [Halosimplex aquaticum]
MEHVERSLNSRDAVLNKDPYPMGRLAVDAYSPPSLAAACHRYLWIEHTAQRKEEYDHYRKLPTQRMLSGKSIPVSINKVEEKNSRTLHVEGVVRFDLPFLRNEEEIRRACRQKGSEGSSSGSWMVANPYDFGRLDTETTQPYEIESGVQVTLETLDLDSRAISFDAHNFYGEGDDFGRTHDKWTTEEKYDTSDSNQTYFANGEQVILDPQTDDITAGRAKAALDHADTNELHEVLKLFGLETSFRPKPAVSAIMGWIRSRTGSLSRLVLTHSRVMSSEHSLRRALHKSSVSRGLLERERLPVRSHRDCARECMPQLPITLTSLGS